MNRNSLGFSEPLSMRSSTHRWSRNSASPPCGYDGPRRIGCRSCRRLWTLPLAPRYRRKSGPRPLNFGWIRKRTSSALKGASYRRSGAGMKASSTLRLKTSGSLSSAGCEGMPSRKTDIATRIHCPGLRFSISNFTSKKNKSLRMGGGIYCQLFLRCLMACLVSVFRRHLTSVRP